MINQQKESDRATTTATGQVLFCVTAAHRVDMYTVIAARTEN